MFTISKKGTAMASLAICSFMFISACKNKADYTDAQKQVLAIHDKVMADGGRAEGKELQFNALLKSGLKKVKVSHPALDTAAERVQIISLNKKLSDADDQMESWMHAYNNDFKGKTDQETLDYFIDQKTKVAKLDSLYQSALKLSDDYLKQLNIKPTAAMALDHKMKM
jgi:mannitol-specific phosphotransferase system IIBC component